MAPARDRSIEFGGGPSSEVCVFCVKSARLNSTSCNWTSASSASGLMAASPSTASCSEEIFVGIDVHADCDLPARDI